MSVLAQVAAAADPALSPYRVAEPGRGRFEASLDPERAFVLEAVHEGYLLHYGDPRAFEGLEEDLRLLAGDSLYALGLARLAALGDLAAVAELADLISLCAWAEAEGRGDLLDELWEASAAALAGKGPGARATLAARIPPA